MKPVAALALACLFCAAAPLHAAERALAVAATPGALPGTLALPDGSGPFAVVLLVAGSGPNDRDETIGANKPFADLAQGLARHGIASYRYDKRTRVFGAASHVANVDDEVTDDAVAALRTLATQPEVDPKRVFVLGHSLGALMAPRIVQRWPQAAGAVLMAAPVTLDLDVVLRQSRYIAHQQGLDAATTDAALAPIIAARDAIAHADPTHPPVGEFFHAPASYWLSLRAYDAVATAQALPQPLLILQGDSDYQVTPADDFSHWQAAFAHTTRVTLKHYPGLFHLFMPSSTPMAPSPADYAVPGHVATAVIDDVAGWIIAQQSGKQPARVATP